MPRKSKTDKNEVENPTHVPYQFLGYSLQQTVLLLRLLQADKDTVLSLEVFDDVGIEKDDEKKAVQVKSAQAHNPLSNRALDLWKTLSNWIDAVNSGELDTDNTVFEIYCSKRKECDISKKFADTKTEKEAKEAYDYARSVLFEAGEEIAEGIEPYVNNFFNADRSMVQRLLCRFNIDFSGKSPQEDLRDHIYRMPVDEKLVPDICDWAAGWVKNRIDRKLEKSEISKVSREEFHNDFKAYVSRICFNNILNSFTKACKDAQQIERELSFRTYIKQLDIIDCSDDDKLNAVTDFLQASADRTFWGDKGLVHELSFEEFEEELKRVWLNVKREILIEKKTLTDEEKGQLIYGKCSMHKTQLQNMSVPVHFVPGSFHALSDEKVIGWHPDYEKRVKE